MTSKPRSKQDEELTTLLTKLYTIQEELGAKPKTTDEDKKTKASTTSTMGKGHKAKKTGSRFLEIKSSIVERLQTIHGMLKEQEEREKGRTAVAAGNNPKEIIAAQAEMREQIRQAGEDWNELDALYRGEARKRRSKFSQGELEAQQTLVLKLQQEIDNVKGVQAKGFGRGGADMTTVLNTRALAQLDATPIFEESKDDAGGGGGWTGGVSAPGAETTDGQRLALQQLESRDAEFDETLDVIGEGIQDLHDIAKMQGEEVKRQNVMLDNLGNRVDNLNEHVLNVNTKMKDTLQEMGRSSGKLCVDISCILLAIGFAGIFYKMYTNKEDIE